MAHKNEWIGISEVHSELDQHPNIEIKQNEENKWQDIPKNKNMEAQKHNFQSSSKEKLHNPLACGVQQNATCKLLWSIEIVK